MNIGIESLVHATVSRSRAEHRPVYGIRPYNTSRHTATDMPVTVTV